MAATGTTTASFTVSASRRTFTNWLGNSDSSVLSKMARSFTVPVVRSITLSVVSSRPTASSFFCERSSTRTSRFSPVFSRCRTSGRESSGIVNRTEIGCTWMMTQMLLASPMVT